MNYKKLFSNYEVVFLIRNLGLSVTDSMFVRSKLKLIGVKFMVTKNSLAKIAIAETRFSSIEDLFSGPVIVAYADDPISTAKLLVQLCEEVKKMSIVGGAMLDKKLSQDDVILLSKMLSQKEIRGKIIGLLNAVANRLVIVLKEPGSKLVRIIKSYAKKQ